MYWVISYVARLLYDAASAVIGALYWVAAYSARLVYDTAGAVLGYVYDSLSWTFDWGYVLVLRTIRHIQWWYWITLASEGKTAALFAASILADIAAWKMAANPRRQLLVRVIYLLEAALFSWALGHLIELYAISRWWGGLQLASMGIWSVLPFFVVVMARVRPLFYEGVAFFALLLHLFAYSLGVSGNGMIAFDISLAVMIMVGADRLKAQLGRHAFVIRYAAIGIVCFLLYCCGFIWDLPPVFEFQAAVDPSSLSFSCLFLSILLVCAIALIGWNYWRKGSERTRNDGLFSLLLVFTLLFSIYSTGILLGLIPLGTVYDLRSHGYTLNVFAANVTLATFLAWTGWFLWCLWLLVESSELNSGLMAQIAVTALLGSLETRYIEVVVNFSFTLGLIVLPLVLALVLVEVRIIRRWLSQLELASAETVYQEGRGNESIL